METITITHRFINGKSVYNKRFDGYDKGFYGAEISKKEYEETSKRELAWDEITDGNKGLSIVQRLTVVN